MMKRVVFVLMAIVSVATDSVTAQSSTLATFVGKDIQKCSGDELATLLKLLGEEEGEALPSFTSWYVWKIDRGEAKRFIVFEGKHMVVIPGDSTAIVHLFDEQERKVKEWSFRIGWRLDLTEASFKFSDDLNAYALTILTEPVVGGTRIYQEYYGFKNDDLRLIRLETKNHRVVPNQYQWPNSTIGPPVSKATRKQWISQLESHDKVAVLATLEFIGGRHVDLSDLHSTSEKTDIQEPRDSPDPFADVRSGPPEIIVERAKLANELRSDTRVRRLMAKYCESGNTWIAEAAELAAQQMKIQ